MPVALFLAACGSGDLTDLEDYVRQVQARQPDPIAPPLSERESIGAFAYEPENRRDPFVPDRRDVSVATAPAADGTVPDPLRRKEKLERFPLDVLAMVGTLARGGITWALVATPHRTLFRVGVGDYVGTNHGRITRITEEKIELTELVSDDGEWRERRATLALSR